MASLALSQKGKKRKILSGFANLGGTPKSPNVAYSFVPRKHATGVETLTYKIYGFADENEAIITDYKEAHGDFWALEIHPTGMDDSGAYISAILKRLVNEGETLTAKFSIRCKQYTYSSPASVFYGNTGRGADKLLLRSDVLENYLDNDGDLVIEVDLQIYDHKPTVWYPTVDIPNFFLTKLYNSINDTMSDNTHDVTFHVGQSAGVYWAHSVVLSQHAETMYEMVKEYRNKNEDEEAAVPIPDVKVEVFEMVLEFVYCVRTPEIADGRTAAKLLEAADRFGCTDLKLFTESTIVEKFLNPTSAAEWLVTSDGRSCALLKEASMKICHNEYGIVTESEGWPKVRESNRLLEELFKFAAAGDRPIGTWSDDDTLDVTSLRNLLKEANLDVDGSREILLARLNAFIAPKKVETIEEKLERVRRGEERPLTTIRRIIMRHPILRDDLMRHPILRDDLYDSDRD